MFWNDTKIALRNILKRKVFSLINIIGLSISIAATILIMLYVLNELSYDNSLKNVSNKYRVITHFKFLDEEFDDYVSNGMLAFDLKDHVSGLKNVFQLYVEFPYIQYNEKVFLEDNDDVYYVGEGIIDFFSLQFVSGDPELALREPFTMVITESFARKYFGDQPALGKNLTLNSEFPYIVTGVVKDFPQNSHFRFNVLLSLSSLLKVYEIPDFYSLQNSFITYIELDNDKNIKLIEDFISKISEDYLPLNVKERGVSVSNYLQPVNEIHLKSSFNDSFKGGDIKVIYIFLSIALLILLLAIINYINLSTAQYLNRTTEVAIRKTCGAGKSKLIKQFLTQSFILTFISLIVSLVIVEFILPGFNKIIGFDLKITYFSNWYDVFIILLVGLFVGFSSSIYPAFFLSSFQVVDVFKMKIGVGQGNINTRRVLVIFQFAITLFLIMGTLVVYKQLRFVNEKNLGFDKTNLVSIRLNNEELISQIGVFKSEINQLSFVNSSSVCSNYPGGEATWEGVFEFEDHADRKFPSMTLLDVDYDYLKTMKIRLKDGRNFSEQFRTDSLAVLINETLAYKMGWRNPIGKKIIEKSGEFICKYHVIGIFEDYHKESLHSKIKPMILRLAERKRFLMVRLKQGNKKDLIKKIQNVWVKFSPDKPFQNIFIDEEFDQLYKSERKLSSILIYFSILAIVIACLGLFGLISFFAKQKTKEIAIRKILGARIKDIAFILAREFILLQLISIIIAIPFSFFVMNKWMSSFVYHTKINWWVFIIAVIAIFIISMITISSQVYKAASVNPVKNLKVE